MPLAHRRTPLLIALAVLSVFPDCRPRASVLGFLALGPDGLACRLLSVARCATIQRMIEYAVDIAAGSLITADKQGT